MMNFDAMLRDLKTQRAALDEAIFVIERLATDGPKKRGRPTKRSQELKRQIQERNSAGK